MKITSDNILYYKLEDLRNMTLNNNLLWLESFGCKIYQEKGLISIENSKMPDYFARVIISPPKQANEKALLILNEFEQESIKPEIFIDENSTSPILHSILDSKGFKPIEVNATFARVLFPGPKTLDFFLRPAEVDENKKWSSLYSRGFNHYGIKKEIDRIRWLHAFETSDSVKHWFIVKNKSLIGVCQTCIGNSVVGIYSFTLSHSNRTLSTLHGALLAIRMKLTEQGAAVAYFEKRFKENIRTKKYSAKPLLGFKVIRKLIGYRRVK